MAPLATVTPFFPSHTLIPSLSSFIAQLPPLTSPSALKAWYTSASTDPLHPALLFCAGLSFLVWVLGEITGELQNTGDSGLERERIGEGTPAERVSCSYSASVQSYRALHPLALSSYSVCRTSDGSRARDGGATCPMTSSLLLLRDPEEDGEVSVQLQRRSTDSLSPPLQATVRPLSLFSPLSVR